MVQTAVTVAGIQVEPVLDGWSINPPGMILVPPPDAPPDWDSNGTYFGPEGWRLPLGGFLVRTGDRVVLVDAGMGPMHVDGHIDTGRLPEALRAAGVTPDLVTDVVLSHLHVDHVGWVSQEGVPTFPNAVHHWHRDDWDHVRRDAGGDHGVANQGIADRLLPAADLLRLVDGPRSEVLPGIVLRHLPGHTPGNCLVEVGDGDDRVLLLGDTAHHHAQLVEDGWEDNFDADRAMARRVRAELADELERGGTPAVGAHFDDVRFGRVVRGADGRRRWELLQDGPPRT
jgi:glyoxylase-like metal-dependent hydrolase (beta-lactamase superfamily II)